MAAENNRDPVAGSAVEGGACNFRGGAIRIGDPRSIFCPVAVPAKAALWLATDSEAARYNGQHFMAQEFVRERGLWPKWETILPMNPNWSPTAFLDWRERRSR